MTPTTDPLPPLTAFQAWLTAQPRSMIIGERLACGACPVARWLTTVFGVPVYIDEKTIEVDYAPTGLVVYETPEMYARVVMALDYCTYGYGTGGSVTVGECLLVVREILGEEE